MNPAFSTGSSLSASGLELGSLFSGIGGFELAWTRLGGTVAWMCEVDAKARKVLEARFPGVPIHPDVTELDPDEVEAVDVLSGGSPCQGFSIAGARTGLLHGESRLFADYIRIMDGLAERGLKWAVWENVPGVLSIKNPDGERTFPHVIAALVGSTNPVPLNPRRKWNAGVVAHGGRSVAWRVVDSRHFGVPQRRRRVYAAVAFGDTDGGQAGRAVLAFPEGVRRDPPACITQGQAAPGGARGRAAGASWWDGGPDAGTLTTTSDAQRMPDKDRLQPVVVPDVAGTLGAKGSGGIDDLDRMTFIPDQPQNQNPDVARTLKARADGSWTADGRGNEVVVDRPQAYGMIGASGEEGATAEEQPAITASHGQPGNVAVPAVLMTMREGKPGGGKDPLLSEEESLTLATGNGQTLFEPQAFRKSKRAQSDQDDETWVADGNANTLTVFDGGDTRTTHAVVEPVPLQDTREVEKHQTGLGVGQPGDPSYTLDTVSRPGVGSSYGVRRLTPVECERLQAFPDGWTEPAGSDSARYKGLGNAITVNVAEWLFARILSPNIEEA